jgi:predicted alpha-1,2-mannosidase
MAKFTFPSKSGAKLLFYTTQLNLIKSNEDLPNTSISGYSRKASSAFNVYFFARFDRSFSSARILPSLQGGKYLNFDTSSGSDTVVTMKIGMSYVSVDNAKLNLDSECPTFDFEEVKSKAQDAWNKTLSKILVTGGTAHEQSKFYQYLYQCFFHPNVASDVNNEYMGFDQKVHSAEGFTYYTSYSIWDTYRSWIPLISWLMPARANDMVTSLIMDAQQGGGGMPRWIVANEETGVMETGSSTPWVANAYAFGAKSFNTSAAWEAMNRVESAPGTKCQDTEERYHLVDFKNLGYVPMVWGDYILEQCASFTEELCIADYALAQFAASINKPGDYHRYMRMSTSWKNLFNSTSLYLQPKYANGTWVEAFDPTHGHFKGFVEGNAMQYTWMISFAWTNLFSQMGGFEAVNRRLDTYFTELNAGQDSEYHWAGNLSLIPYFYYHADHHFSII